MGDLSPIKILVVLIIALVVLGPEKLPEMTRKAGRAWAEFGRFRDSMHSQVREVVGDVPGLDELRDLPGIRRSFAASLLTSSSPRYQGAADSPDDGILPAPGEVGPPAEPPGGAWQPRRPGGERTVARRGPVFAPDDPGLN
jgi:TatA/E family protein of Tat protein translocase